MQRSLQHLRRRSQELDSDASTRTTAGVLDGPGAASGFLSSASSLYKSASSLAHSAPSLALSASDAQAASRSTQTWHTVNATGTAATSSTQSLTGPMSSSETTTSLGFGPSDLDIGWPSEVINILNVNQLPPQAHPTFTLR